MNDTQELNKFLRCFLEINNPAIGNLAAHSGHANYEYKHEHEHDNVGVDVDDHQQENEYGGPYHSHELLLAKGIAMVVLFCASTFCGSLPTLLDRYFCWTKKERNARSAILIKCLLYFGGGILLATTFLHLLPEVQGLVEQLHQCSVLPPLTFPLPELLMCCGFFLMYFIEEAIHGYIHLSQNRNKDAAATFERGHSIRNSHLVMRAPVSLDDITNCNYESPSRKTTTATLSVQNLLQIDLENQKYSVVASNSKDQRQQKQNQRQRRRRSQDHIHLPLNNGSSVNSSDNVSDFIASSLRGLFIVLALSLHELFEGMAIGLESSASSVWFMFGAVSAHKLVLAFCVGVELIVAGTSRALSIVYILTFAIVSPMGIGIGILISRNQDNTGTNLISVILQGLACGTLLYVVFFEILSKNRAGLKAYLALFVGFIIMFGLQQLGAHNGHGHSHEHKCNPMRGDIESSHHQQQHQQHHHHDHDESNNLKSKKSENYDQQLQMLRQVTKQLLESNHNIE